MLLAALLTLAMLLATVLTLEIEPPTAFTLAMLPATVSISLTGSFRSAATVVTAEMLVPTALTLLMLADTVDSPALSSAVLSALMPPATWLAWPDQVFRLPRSVKAFWLKVAGLSLGSGGSKTTVMLM